MWDSLYSLEPPYLGFGLLWSAVSRYVATWFCEYMITLLGCSVDSRNALSQCFWLAQRTRIRDKGCSQGLVQNPTSILDLVICSHPGLCSSLGCGPTILCINGSSCRSQQTRLRRPDHGITDRRLLWLLLLKGSLDLLILPG